MSDFQVLKKIPQPNEPLFAPQEPDRLFCDRATNATPLLIGSTYSYRRHHVQRIAKTITTKTQIYCNLTLRDPFLLFDFNVDNVR